MFITVASGGNDGQNSSKILVKELIFRKAGSPATLAVNYLTCMFRRF